MNNEQHLHIISKDQAKSLGMKQYFTGKVCRNGHIAARWIFDGKCRECSRLKSTRYGKKNREKIAGYKRNYYVVNREKLAEYNRMYQADNREKIAERLSKNSESPQGRTAHLLKLAKGRAKQKHLDFTLTHEFVLGALEAGTCQLTGLPFVLEQDERWRRHPLGPSLYKSDPADGYTGDNVRVVTWGINILRNEYPEEITKNICSSFLGTVECTADPGADEIMHRAPAPALMLQDVVPDQLTEVEDVDQSYWGELTWEKSPRGRAYHMVNTAKRRAKEKGIPYELDLEDIHKRVLTGRCELTGIPLEFRPTEAWSRGAYAPSLQRKDPSKGYTRDNAQIVCLGVNTLLGQYPDSIARGLAQSYLNSIAR